MRDIHALLKEAFAREGLDYPLLMQGESSRTELLDRAAYIENHWNLPATKWVRGLRPVIP